MKYLAIVLLFIIIIVAVASIVGINIGTSLPEGYTFGVSRGVLAPCKDTPNCVSSQAPDTEHSVEPFRMRGSVEEEKSKILKIIKNMPRSKVIEEKPDYIRAEFRSRTFKFVDDVEFYFDSGPGIIHVRSAARTGKGDFGVNRKRVEYIWSELKKINTTDAHHDGILAKYREAK